MKVKILVSIGFFLALIGGILFIVARLTVEDAVDFTWLAENTQDATLKVEGGDDNRHFGFSIYVGELQDCRASLAGMQVTGPAGQAEPAGGWSIESQCHAETRVKIEGTEVKQVGHLIVEVGNAAVEGNFRVRSNTPMWIMSWGDELGEAVRGFFKAIGMVIVAIAFLIAGSIFCCVSCCCCGPPQSKQPVVAGAVIGQPVGTA